MVKKILSDRKSILTLIFLVACILRLLGLLNIELRGDFAEHWKTAGEIAGGKHFPLIGPSASVNPNIHLGPFYYYLLSIPYLLGEGDYKIAIIFFSILNSLSVFPLYHLSKKWFGERVGFKVVILYSLSSYIIQVQNFPWNPYLISALMILSLYLLEKVWEKHVNYLPLLFLLLGLGLSFHATFVFVIPLFLIFIPFRKLSRKILLISSLLFFIPLSPWIYFEINNNFAQAREMVSVFSPDREVCNFSLWLANHGNGERCFHQIRNTLFIFRLFSQSLFTTRNLFFVLVSFLVTLYTLYNLTKTKSRLKTFFVVWIFIIFLFFLTYSNNIYPHFFLILIPFPFFIFVLFLEKIGKINKYSRYFSNILFLITIGWNLFNYFNSLWYMRG